MPEWMENLFQNHEVYFVRENIDMFKVESANVSLNQYTHMRYQEIDNMSKYKRIKFV